MERKWLNCTSKSGKAELKSEYVTSRKIFDREVQRSKRTYWFNLQRDLVNECNFDNKSFWKSIGRVEIGQTQKRRILMEVVMEDGCVSRETTDVLDKWRRDFSSLLNCQNDRSFDNNFGQYAGPSEPLFDTHISILEVKKAIGTAKKGKACGIDAIPVEVLCNVTSVSFLHILFNVCFDKGIVPSAWSKCIINPIPKSSTTDPRDPLSYRGIALASTMYKLYCSIINTCNRLSSWCEANGKIVDEQNGFRESRSTTDQVSTLTNIIDSRKKRKLSTFCAFIDFRKAYDCINRDILWAKLDSIGVSGKLFNAVKSLYASVASCVRINNLTTDWFDVSCGLRQGCCLSPLLFNIFINDVAVRIKALGKGVMIDEDLVCILMYADDIVLISENAEDLQLMLNCLNEWCGANAMSVNASKSNVVHFRPNSIPKTGHGFTCGEHHLVISDRYTYLGLTLNEYLDFNVTARAVAQSASRALGLLIAKSKCMGGMPYDVYSKLYATLVWPVISYGASIWGTKSYSCVNAVQNRAMRFFLGTGKYTPTAAVSGDMGWQSAYVKQWKCICIYWNRMVHMDTNRVNRRAFCRAENKSGMGCKNSNFVIKYKFRKLGLTRYCDIGITFSRDKLISDVLEKLTLEFVAEWHDAINRETGRSGIGGNKLRTYRIFKSSYETEQYCKVLLPVTHRAAFAKFRCGVAPIRIETGRFENLNVDQRLCHFCKDTIEDETHVVLFCSAYDDLRNNLVSKAVSVLSNFSDLSAKEKMKFLFTNPNMIRTCAKTCFKILQQRSFLLYK